MRKDKRFLIKTAKKMAGSFRTIKKLGDRTGKVDKSKSGNGKGVRSQNASNNPYEPGSLKSSAGKLYGPKSTGRSSVPGDKIFKHTYTKQELKQVKISANIEDNLAFLEHLLGASNDFMERRVMVTGKVEAAVLYMDGLAKEERISKEVLQPLQGMSGRAKKDGEITLKFIKEQVVYLSCVRDIYDMHEVVDSLLYGGVVIFLDGESYALSHAVQGWEHRMVEEPVNESVVRGPREGFTETLRTNTGLLRRKLRTPNLVIEEFNLGAVTHTSVAIAYIKGIASPDLVKEVKSRLKRIRTDAVIESDYIEEFIEDNPRSPFPQVIATERPDKTIGNLLEGRVAILTDNTPFALVVPVTLNVFFHAAEDYYERFFLGSALRILRYIAFLASLILPSFYVALTTFHQEMVPLTLLLRIAAAREGVPFPAVVEALMMQFTFEILREAGVRLPRVVGQAVSIVGALVIGNAAVSAGLVSPLMVIVVALTGIASFTMPSFSFGITARILLFPQIGRAHV